MRELNNPSKIFISRGGKVYLALLILACVFLSGCGADNGTALLQQRTAPSSAEPKISAQVPLTDSDGAQLTSQTNTLADVIEPTPSSVLLPMPTSRQVETVEGTDAQTSIPAPILTSTPAPQESTTLAFTSEPTNQMFSFLEELDIPTGDPAEEETQYLPLIIHQDVPTPTSTPKQPVLLFSDEFKGTSLDLTKWETQYPWGGTLENNGELECYLPNSVRLNEGVLKLTAIEKNVTCIGMDGQTKNLPYRSGMIASHGHFSFEYGFVEIRAKVPAGPGLWPAFWLLPEVEAPNTIDWPPEIDILEVLGNEPTKLYMGNWDGTEFNPLHYAGDYIGPDFSADFHVFGLRWTPDILIWYVDGIERFRSDQGVPTVPMYLIANLAVGGNWPGPPNDDTEFPSSFEVDYIRVYDEGF